MVPAANDSKDCHDDVNDEKEFIRKAAHPENAPHEHSADKHGAYYSPLPIWKLEISFVSAGLDTSSEEEDRVQDSVQSKETRYPAMQQKVSRMRPIGEPQQNVVPTSEENGEGQEREGKFSSSVPSICKDLTSLVITPRMDKGPLSRVVHTSENNVE